MTPHASFLEKFRHLEHTLSDEKGPLSLFALVLRQDQTAVASTSSLGAMTERWDLLIAAPWIYEDKKGSFEYVDRKLRAVLSQEEILSLSRVALLKPDNAFVVNMNAAFAVEHGSVELINTNVFGIEIRHGFVVTSRRRLTAGERSRKNSPGRSKPPQPRDGRRRR